MPLSDVVPALRLAPYRAIVGNDEAGLDRFYRWSQSVSLAFFADVSTLEVTMRSAMAQVLAATYGISWFTRADIFDDPTMAIIRDATRRNRLDVLQRRGASPAMVESQMVAALSLGFWVKLLGRGASAAGQRRIYDTLLWKPALSRSFPASPSRRAVERHGYTVLTARNRIAHHEPIIWGVPLPGQARRLTVAAAHNTLLELAGFISPSTEQWIRSHSTVRAVLEACPVDDSLLRLQ